MGRPRNDKIVVRMLHRSDREPMFRWIDPATGRERTKKATADTEEGRALEALELQIKLRREQGQAKLDWLAFLEVARPRFVALKSKAYRQILHRAIRDWEAANGVLDDVTVIGPVEIGRFQARIRKGKTKSEATCGKDLRAIKALFGWGKRNGFIERVAHIELPRKRRGFSGKGRPLDDQQFAALKRAVADYVGPKFAASWETALDGLWRSGMRLGELLALTFDRLSAGQGGAMTIRWGHEDQKSRRAETTPTTPEFAELVRSLPYDSGRVFRPELSRGVVRIDTFSHTIDEACRAAGIKATSHDLRRSFADRWSRKVQPLVLSRLMRCSLEVIRVYYAELEAESISQELMRSHDREKTGKTDSEPTG